jgi:hypothetical protein
MAPEMALALRQDAGIIRPVQLKTKKVFRLCLKQRETSFHWHYIATGGEEPPRPVTTARARVGNESNVVSLGVPAEGDGRQQIFDVPTNEVFFINTAQSRERGGASEYRSLAIEHQRSDKHR